MQRVSADMKSLRPGSQDPGDPMHAIRRHRTKGTTASMRYRTLRQYCIGRCAVQRRPVAHCYTAIGCAGVCAVEECVPWKRRSRAESETPIPAVQPTFHLGDRRSSRGDAKHLGWCGRPLLEVPDSGDHPSNQRVRPAQRGSYSPTQ